MKKITHIGALLLSIALILALVPAAAFAQDGPEVYISGSTAGTVSNPKKPAEKKWLTGDKLTGIDRGAYDYISGEIQKIARGQRSSTEIQIPVSQLNIPLTYTAQDLGVDHIWSGDWNPAAVEAIDSMLSCNIDLLLDCLLTDFPYDLYWYDKTLPTIHSGVQYSAGYDTLTIESDTMSFWLPAAKEYGAGEPEVDDGIEFYYYVDTALAAATQAAYSKAEAIVSANASKTDYEKILAYKNAICDMTGYNNDAANNDDTPYGNPWQLIWVFDDDPSTNVVCEGYSKAFQLLCDLSHFNSDLITCWTVTGSMDGGAHMWNIIRMDDGRYYMVDVTNCDTGTTGYPDLLFLKGWESWNGTYQYYVYDNTVYLYDASLYDFIGSAVLNNLSKTDYDPSAPAAEAPTVFWAKPQGAEDNDLPAEIKHLPGDSFAVTVDAYAGKGALSYQWYIFDVDDESETGYSWYYLDEDTQHLAVHDKYVYISDLDRNYELSCDVTDCAGTVIEVFFNVTVDSGLRLFPVGNPMLWDITGEGITLEVEASVDYGNVAVEWYRQKFVNGEVDFDLLAGENGTSLQVDNTNVFNRFIAVASDDYGNIASYEFYTFPYDAIPVQQGANESVGYQAAYGTDYSIMWMKSDLSGSQAPEMFEDVDYEYFEVNGITSDTRILRVDLLDPETPIGGAVFDILVVPEGGIVKGDVTGDGAVSADDLTALSRYVAQIETGWSIARLAAADVTGEGDVDANDLTLLSRYVANIITEWP